MISVVPFAHPGDPARTSKSLLTECYMDQASHFTPPLVTALNDVAGFLALNDFGPRGSDQLPAGIAASPIDCIILAGNCVLETAEGAFRLIGRGTCTRLLISGGIGHATEVLRQKVAAHSDYQTIHTEGRAEAHILADIGLNFWGIDRSSLLIEPDSTNSGENAKFSRRLHVDSSQPMKTILLIQDPTMQRRVDATFRHIWRDRPDVSFLNWPTFTPRVRLVEDEVQFNLGGIAGLWPLDRFLALVIGEIPRLRDDSDGYGPNGKGFIAHLDIPKRIEKAYACLQEALAEGFGNRSTMPRPSLA
ncbi:YdcF family protein [Microvirga sp. Mcv34]|uniref:YdcF family protein n=1 Tax=Microvirga sp. Mcv34 TaxID=2926016 RepID=UPI0021CA6421|nr:YdcF family protein [Microvirga sp. Mcv34]